MVSVFGRNAPLRSAGDQEHFGFLNLVGDSCWNTMNKNGSGRQVADCLQTSVGDSEADRLPANTESSAPGWTEITTLCPT